MWTLCLGQMQRPAAKISAIQCGAESKLVFPQKHRQDQSKTITLNLSCPSWPKVIQDDRGAGGGWQPIEYGRWCKKLFKIKQKLSEIFEIKCEEAFPYIKDEWKLRMFISNLFPNIAAWPVPWTSSQNNQLGIEVQIKDAEQISCLPALSIKP